MGAEMDKKRFLRENPLCCFCGGLVKSEEPDHQPAKIVFVKKERPEGLELPSCRRCNRLTSIDDCILSFVAQMAGSLRQQVTGVDISFKKAFQTLQTNRGELLERMQKTGKWTLHQGKIQRALDYNQPEINEGLCRIAAKLALGTYYIETGKIARPGTHIETAWGHNQRGNAVELVNNLLGQLPKFYELNQGKKWNTSDSFFLRHLVKTDEVYIAAIFHQSVALIAYFKEGEASKERYKLAGCWTPSTERGLELLEWRGAQVDVKNQSGQ
ncbi:MAG: hypothetical protein JSR99_17875 [Proteobacteria bacterium]|nr:hypothetical protein [Pseudomonadota bacterium]